MILDRLNGQITYLNPVIIKASGRATRIQWKVESSTLQSGVLHLYKSPPKGALQRLMYFEGSSKVTKDPDAPPRYSGSVKGDLVTLTILKLEQSDEGLYYCTLWSEDNTVLTLRGNHGKNLLSSSKRFYLELQQGGDIRHILIVMLLFVVKI